MPTRLAILDSAYLRDVLEQPAAITRTAQALENSLAAAGEVRRLARTRSIDRIVLTGMGSSFHALHPLRIRLCRAGFFAEMFETSELLSYYPETLSARTMTIAVSQSGESAEIVRLLGDRLISGPVVGITNTAGSTLARQANVPVLTAAGPESTVSCKTYLATLQALHWLGSEMLELDPHTVQEQLQAAQSGVAKYLSAWQSHADWFVDQLSEVSQLFVTGRGWSLATAGTGGLILKESVHFPAEGLSSAAFRHGPFDLLSRKVLTCICLGAPRTAALNRRLHTDVLNAGGRSFLLEEDSAYPALDLPPVPAELLPMVEILPIQMISLALAALLGHEAGRFSLATKITAVE